MTSSRSLAEFLNFQIVWAVSEKTMRTRLVSLQVLRTRYTLQTLMWVSLWRLDPKAWRLIMLRVI